MSSIVMAHGLNGGRLSTWTAGQVCWPRDLLYEKIPRARIMTFGYDASVIFSSETSKIRDYSLRLLIELRDKRESDQVKRHALSPSLFKQESNGLAKRSTAL